MGDSKEWDVDRVAASSLLAALQIEPSAETTDLIAKHFASHRDRSLEWAADRIQSQLVAALEELSRAHFARANDQWIRGFKFVEEEVLTMDSADLLGLNTIESLSQGQILRSMMQSARKN